jgi:hypothetical protein
MHGFGLDDQPIVRKAGAMAVVERGGGVTPRQPIEVELPAGLHERLEPV